MSISPPDVTINHVYGGTCNHVPREAAKVMLSKPVAVLESSSSYLRNCFEEAVSDQERLKMILIKMVSEIGRYISEKTAWYYEHVSGCNFKMYYKRGELFDDWTYTHKYLICS